MIFTQHVNAKTSTMKMIHLPLSVLSFMFFIHVCSGTCPDGWQYEGITVAENSTEGQKLTDLKQDPADTVKITSGNDFGVFDIVNGSLYINKSLELDGTDNKQACDWFNPSGTLEIEYNRRTCSLRIDVKYSDDYQPYFNQNVYTLYIPEKQPTNTLVTTLGGKEIFAKDADCGNEWIVYDFEENPYLHKDRATSDLLTKIEFDFERLKTFSFNISAYSNEKDVDSYKTGTALVEVIVQDVDDMPPVFMNNNYELIVQEEEDLSQKWRETKPKLEARDGDVGLDVSINYSILSSTPKIDIDINSTTGLVMVNGSLDRETTDMYMVVIQATQSDDDLMTATTTLIVKVSDVNDNRPAFTPTLTKVTVREDAPKGQYITLVSAQDNDKGDNAVTTYELQSDAFELGTDVNNQTWLKVKNGSALYGLEQINVKIKAIEKTNPSPNSPPCGPSNCELTVEVKVDDENLNSPKFLQKSYEFQVLQDVDIGVVTASDADRGVNAEIVYSLFIVTNNADCHNAKMDPKSGNITLQNKILPGITCFYLAKACDSPTDVKLRRCSSVPVTLKMGNTTSTHHGQMVFYNERIRENQPIGTNIIELSISGLQTDDPRFEVSDRLLKTSVILDREKTDFFNISLYIGSQRTDPAALVQISVDDVNDNIPNFETHNDSITLENNNVGDVIFKFKANDQDIDENGKLEYSLLSGQNWFSIDANSGALTLTKEPPQSPEPLEVIIQVNDLGEPRLQSVTSLKVLLSSTNMTSQITLPVPPSQLRQDIQGLTDKLSTLLSVPVSVERIVNLGDVPDMGSVVSVTAISEDGQPLSNYELNKLITNKANLIHEAFKTSMEDDNTDDDMTPLVIALICVAGFLFIICVIIIIVIYRYRKSNQRRSRLISKLTKDTSLYDSTAGTPTDDRRKIINLMNGNGHINDGYVNQAYLTEDGATHEEMQHTDSLSSFREFVNVDLDGYSEIGKQTSPSSNQLTREIPENNTNSSTKPVFKSIINIGDAGRKYANVDSKVKYVAEVPDESDDFPDETEVYSNVVRPVKSYDSKSGDSDSGHGISDKENHDEDKRGNGFQNSSPFVSRPQSSLKSEDQFKSNKNINHASDQNCINASPPTEPEPDYAKRVTFDQGPHQDDIDRSNWAFKNNDSEAPYTFNPDSAGSQGHPGFNEEFESTAL